MCVRESNSFWKIKLKVRIHFTISQSLLFKFRWDNIIVLRSVYFKVERFKEKTVDENAESAGDDDDDI